MWAAIANGWTFVGGGVLAIAEGIGAVSSTLGEGAVTVIKTVFQLV